MVETLDHSENCCPACAEKISRTDENIKKIADAISTIDLASIGNSTIGKMLGLGKK